jgi:hypothetical protein
VPRSRAHVFITCIAPPQYRQPLRLPRLPADVSAAAVLEGTSHAADAGERWNTDKHRKLVGRSVVVTRRSAATRTWLRRWGVEGADDEEVRLSTGIYARHKRLRRSNPRHAEQLDDFILGLLVLACDVERQLPVVRREGIAMFLNVPEHAVSQSLERLNKLGLLGPEKNSPPPGSDRHRTEGADHSGWQGSTRLVRWERLQRYLAERGVSPRGLDGPGCSPLTLRQAGAAA